MILCNKRYYFAYLVQIKIILQKVFNLLIGSFLIELTFLSQNEHFFRKLESSLEVQRSKEKFSDNPARNILELYNFQYGSDSPQVKRNLISSITILVYELRHKLPNDLRLRILGNQKMFKKSQIWVKTVKKPRKSFPVLSSFTGFLYFVPSILSKIVD